MNSSHLSQEELESYVIGALQGRPADALEAHAARCDPCAAELARQARFSRLLNEAVLTPGPIRARARSPWRRRAVIIGLMAAAAVTVTVFVVRSQSPTWHVPNEVACFQGRMDPAAYRTFQGRMDPAANVNPQPQGPQP